MVDTGSEAAGQAREATPAPHHSAPRRTVDRLTDSAVPAGSTRPADVDTPQVLTGVLVRALRALGEHHDPVLASRLAAEAYAAVRREHPRAAARLNGVLHYLARLPHHPGISDSPIPEEEPMANAEQELDVRSEPPVRRHDLIFATYENLPVGGAFVLVNDHDPKPLYYQFAAERPGEFSWDYLEQGPEVWKVRIGRTAK